MWRTRRSRQGDEDKKWAPAAEIPKQLRPKLNQIMQYDWPNLTPYPGWVLAVGQGCSGWKCKLMTEKELKAYETDVGKNKNPKSQKRANEVAWAATLRAEQAASSSSGTWKNRTSGDETKIPLRHPTPRMNQRLIPLNTERLLQPPMQRTHVPLKVSYQMTISARDAWMNLVYLWMKSTAQCCHYIWKLGTSRMPAT